MQMEIETFEQTETSGIETEAGADPAALELIERLGLDGQKERVTVRQTTGTQTRCPYRSMTRRELHVYKTLFPEVEKVEKYKASMIPVRVLQVAAHAKELGVYTAIQVWGEATRPKDPILVGIIGNPSWEWEIKDRHLLARWGEALEAFPVLEARAKDAIAKKIRAKGEEVLARVDALADEYLDSGNFSVSL